MKLALPKIPSFAMAALLILKGSAGAAGAAVDFRTTAEMAAPRADYTAAQVSWSADESACIEAARGLEFNGRRLTAGDAATLCHDSLNQEPAGCFKDVAYFVTTPLGAPVAPSLDQALGFCRGYRPRPVTRPACYRSAATLVIGGTRRLTAESLVTLCGQAENLEPISCLKSAWTIGDGSGRRLLTLKQAIWLCQTANGYKDNPQCFVTFYNSLDHRNQLGVQGIVELCHNLQNIP